MARSALLLLPPLAVAIVIAFLAFAAHRSTTESATYPGVLVQTSAYPLKDPVLSAPLAAMADRQSGLASALPKQTSDLLAAGRMRLTSEGAVQVYIHVADVAELDDLTSLGAVVERIDEEARIVQAQAPSADLRALAALPNVERIRLPDYAFAHEGSVQTEGDAVLKSDQLRSLLGVDGSGVTVGVVSDGVGGLATSQGLGDLPAVDTATCNVAGGDPGAEGAEGTAMLEIVYDIAPGADLMFGNFGFATALDFNAAVDCLAANADIVVDDIGWFGVGPYDGTSFVSENTSDALNGPGPIRGYFTAAGNSAQDHYQESYEPSDTVLTGLDVIAVHPLPPEDTWVLHEFDATDGPKGTEHAGVVGPPADGNRVILPEDETMTIVLVWDDPWGTAPNDYDVFIREDDEVYICGGDFQSAGMVSLPVENCSWENTGPGDAELDILIGNYLGEAAPVEFDMFLLCRACSDLGNGNALDFNTASSSVANQSDAGGSPASVISLGAFDHAAPDTIELFSSRGLTEDGRFKPDIVGPDGACITGAGGFGQGSCQGSGARFYGTSAAAPHAAAVAALLLECDPDMGRVELYDRMVFSAIDLGEAGPDNVYGYGRLNAMAAAGACAGELAATPTLTATPTVTATPSPTATFTPTPTPTATPTPTPTPFRTGDANCDGTVNALDAALILQFGAILLPALPCPDAADANVDGEVNPIDATLVLQLAAGLLPRLPP